MSREILFKAKRVDNGEWVEGNIVISEDAEEGYEAIIIPKSNSNMFTKGGSKGDLGFEKWYKVDVNTICQYTGLTDKNGNKIWENDICSVNLICKDTEEKEKCIVRYGRKAENFKIELGFYAEWTKTDYLRMDICYWTENREVEVIGNIFDNPELLKG